MADSAGTGEMFRAPVIRDDGLRIERGGSTERGEEEKGFGREFSCRLEMRIRRKNDIMNLWSIPE